MITTKGNAYGRRSVAVPTGQLARLGHISSMTAQIAGSIVMGSIAQLSKGQRPMIRELLLTPSNINRITEQLAKMRGAAMKIGQLISMDTGDYLPPELAQIMARLRDDAYAMPSAQLKKILNTQFTDNWLASFSKFDVHPIAAASIGQVHRAQLKDGRDIAMKVQYPGVATSIDSDIANVGVLIKLSGLVPKEFKLESYLEEGRKQLHEETNYTREAANISQFKKLLKDVPQFLVPAAHADWSTSNILAMDYVPGITIDNLSQDKQEVRDKVVISLIELALRELFEFGLMQTDPNFANYLYNRDTQQIVLLDFGAVRAINPVIAQKYKRLIDAGLSNDTSDLIGALAEIGFFDAKTRPKHRACIIQMTQQVFDVILRGNSINFKTLDLPQQLQSQGLALLEDGFMPPVLPIDMLLIQRKFLGIFLLANKLAACVNIKNILLAQIKYTL